MPLPYNPRGGSIQRIAVFDERLKPIFSGSEACCATRQRHHAMEDTRICYVLDGILILYGIILTVLYIRLKGLSPHTPDTYETIGVEKKIKM
ncbi:hypothetical protein CRUP_007204 [Coryphaenoides rupestris]|nr:hypothetical protein CRUP_007204 [Coryphaenoides rupestris]